MFRKYFISFLVFILFSVGFIPAPSVSAANNVEVLFYQEILPVRVVVISEQFEIIEMWNHVESDADSFELRVTLMDKQGLSLSVTQSVTEQYKQLLPFLDLDKQGQVYDGGVHVSYDSIDVAFVSDQSGISQEIYTQIK